MLSLCDMKIHNNIGCPGTFLKVFIAIMLIFTEFCGCQLLLGWSAQLELHFQLYLSMQMHMPLRSKHGRCYGQL